jgi:hypothetical protein
MAENILVDKELTRVIDILSQVKKLNKMISLHQNESEDAFMVNQYVDMKNRFLFELKDLLTDYQIEVLINDRAA